MNITHTFKYLALLMLTVLLPAACNKNEVEERSYKPQHKQPNKKVLYINSYHAGYEWSDGITKAILDTFNLKVGLDKKIDSTEGKVDLKIIYMDTKRNSSESYIKNAALKAKKVIDEWSPDLVITSDDNAAKYLIVPYFKGSKIPFVFTGVNWDATEYGFPCSNVTGMTEVQLIGQIITKLRKYSKGDRIAIIKGSDRSAHKEASFFEKMFNIKLDKRFVNNFEEWKKHYLKLQSESDMILLGNSASIPDWDQDQAKQFILDNTSVPTGNWDSWMAQYCLVTLATKAEEQGQWAAQTALDILAGKKPHQIPVVSNKKARIIINMNLARKLNILFPTEFLKNARMISASKNKILYVNSYHKGYISSDSMEIGFQKATGVTAQPDGTLVSNKHSFEMRILRMDTKNNKEEEFKLKAAAQVKGVIESWRPNIVVASDDNASKYLIAPYFRNTKLPFVFCGVNWDATEYGFPCKNVTGILEVEPVLETIAMLQKYANGSRLGYLGPNNISEQKKLPIYRNSLNIQFSDGELVDTFDEWKEVYLRLQKSTDMFLVMGKAGIDDWDNEQALEFILQNSTVPTGGTADNHTPFSTMGHIEITEEQGWEAGKMVIKILNGIPPKEIAVKTNIGSQIFINMKFAEQLSIKLPVEVLTEAKIIK